METTYWTVTYKSCVPKYLLRQVFYYKNAGQIENECTISFEKDKLSLYFEVNFSVLDGGYLIREECIKGLSEDIADILSWKHNLSIDEISVKVSDSERLSQKQKCIISDKNYLNIFPGNYCLKNKQIIEAYREMKNEGNDALRFLMCYRFLEVLAKSSQKRVEPLIKELFPTILKIKKKRDNHNVDIVTYLRSKIHATDNRFKFPYKQLSHSVRLVQGLLVKAIKDEIKK